MTGCTTWFERMLFLAVISFFLWGVGCSITDDTVGGDDSVIIDDDDDSDDDSTIIDTMDGEDGGVVIISRRTENMVFLMDPETGTGVGEVIDLDLGDIRREIESEGIPLSSFSIINIALKKNDSTTYEENLDSPCYMTIRMDGSGGGGIALATPKQGDGVLTLGEIFSGIELDDGLFGVDPYYSQFVDAVKDPDTESLTITGTIVFPEGAEIAAEEAVRLDFTVTGQGKRELE
ncbi:MAG: hypothetical protein ACQEQ4_09255 [Fibrobacterota bacterium]